MPGYAENLPILLNRNVRVSGQQGDLIDLRAIACASPPKVDLLQTDDIVGRNLPGDVLQRRGFRRRMKYLEVRAQEVVAVSARSNTGLDIPSYQVHQLTLSRIMGSRINTKLEPLCT
jgi:hypothetical protein